MQSYASEIEWLKLRVGENPASMLYARLADRYLQINEIDQAIEHAEKCVLLHPHDATSRYVLAKCYYERKEFDNANKHLVEALAADPNHLAALNLQSELARNLGETERARENFDRIIDLDPFDDSIHQKKYDLQHEPTPTTGTLEDDWNLDLATDSEPLVDSSDSNSETTAELPVEEELFFDTADKDSPETYKDDPFADFEETVAPHDEVSIDEEPELFEPEEEVDEPQMVQEQPVVAEEEQIEPQSSPDEPEQVVGERAEPEYSEEEILDESIDDDFEIDRSKFKEEESKFTKLLDNIFSSNMDEEEQLVNEQRSKIEQIAGASAPISDEDESAPIEPTDEPTFEPLLAPEQVISPEEKILRNDREQQDDFFDDSDAIENVLDDDHVPEEFETRDGDIPDSDSDQAVALSDTPEPKSNDFSEFLDSLDIQEDAKGDDKDLPEQLDMPLTALDDGFDMPDDLKEIVTPLSVENDWVSTLSSESSEEESASLEPKEDDFLSDKKEYKPSMLGVDREPVEDQSSSQDDKHKDKFNTPTLGEIYASQGQYAKAISVFETLIKSDPDNDSYKLKLDYLQKKLAEQKK